MTDNCINQLSEALKESKFSGEGLDTFSIEQLILICVDAVGYEEVMNVLQYETPDWWEQQTIKLREKICDI